MWHLSVQCRGQQFHELSVSVENASNSEVSSYPGTPTFCAVVTKQLSRVGLIGESMACFMLALAWKQMHAFN